jgi:hypothetical protein
MTAATRKHHIGQRHDVRAHRPPRSRPALGTGHGHPEIVALRG